MFSFSPVLKTIKQILTPHKGILAADETPATLGKRFAAVGIENTVENRRAYREILFTTPNIENYISGVILQDETIRQTTSGGLFFRDILQKKGIVLGIKVDQGLAPFNNSTNEKITQGIEGLDRRLEEYYSMGARFAKWRAVFAIGTSTPSKECLAANTHLLAVFAKLCLKRSMVPIVEPEVLQDGDHDINVTFETTKKVLTSVFLALADEGVSAKEIILKPNMVVPGENGPVVLPEVVAEKTVECFKTIIPESLPGIVFLSGGQSEEAACINLQAIVQYGKQCPWQWSFSFGRALQNSALQTWAGKKEQVDGAQALFLRRAMMTSDAKEGEYQTF